MTLRGQVMCSGLLLHKDQSPSWPALLGTIIETIPGSGGWRSGSDYEYWFNIQVITDLLNIAAVVCGLTLGDRPCFALCLSNTPSP